MLALLASQLCVGALLPLAPTPPLHAARRVACGAACCICINCARVDRCLTYRWVEQMHEQPHVAQSPDFQPADPQIQVFIRDEAAAAEGALTVEYDVFACDAFVEDHGRWLRLMPDADFIPT
ncbi:hypothetical protein AB1Y20_007758 [Prymnesium parvum]|uniref:Uncharacterized protein n=1 Tax=Prymnesium parvum TaxID=97485 RepID=A0AB34IUF9_PRYPA